MTSGDQLIKEEIPKIFSEFSKSGKPNRFLILCRSRSRRKRTDGLPEGAESQWYFNIRSVDEIEAPERFDLGIVLNQIEHMRRTDAMHLLSRMRDQYCRSVLARIEGDMFSDQELLALGYIRQKRPSDDGRYYLFDPDLFFERREWNTPEHWAHPQNYGKQRW